MVSMCLGCVVPFGVIVHGFGIDHRERQVPLCSASPSLAVSLVTPGVTNTSRGMPILGRDSLPAMSDRDDLRRLVQEIAVVPGRVTLSSGREADYYIDLRRLTLHHAGAPLVGRVLLELTADLEYDAVGGLTLGADPVATAMLHAAAAQGRALDAFVVRKGEKAHGLQRQIEGPEVASNGY